MNNRETVAQNDHFGSLVDESEFQPEYLSIFIDETEMSLDELTETLLASEKGWLNGREAIDRLLAVSHRIKGSAASIGLRRAATLAHLMEDLLQGFLNAGRTLQPEVNDSLLRCTDALRQYIEGLKNGRPQSDRFNALAEELHHAEVTPGHRFALPRPPDNELPTSFPTVSEELRTRVNAATLDPNTTLVGCVVFEPGLPLAGLKGRLIYDRLANLGEVCFFDPPSEDLDQLESLDGVSFGLVADMSPEVVSNGLRLGGVSRIEVEPLLQAGRANDPARIVQLPDCPQSDLHNKPTKTLQPPRVYSPGAKYGADLSNKPTRTLRVDIQRLDNLMNLAGQLTINKARFSQIGSQLRNSLAVKQSSRTLCNAMGTLEKVRSSMNELFDTIDQLDRVSNGIRQGVIETRMLPIGPLFGRFKRIVRDISRAGGKDIRLVIRGEKTELDKLMIDELGDPLIHAVRNAADHGIEPPEVRKSAGKPPHGTITLDAFHSGNSIVVRVTDDGKGLDVEQIRRKAVENGLVAKSDAETMTSNQVMPLIWKQGFSTADVVTEISGRGVGMEIVKSSVEELGGTIDLESEPGLGTTLTIKLPLTLAIVPCLMVEIDGDIIAVPLESVVEIVRLGKQDITTVHGQQIARLRDCVISAVRLDEIFTWSGSSSRSCRDLVNEETTLVIISKEDQELALAIDRVLGKEDIVVKSMDENYRNVPGIAGASILGDGRVSLILDVAAVVGGQVRGSKAPALHGGHCEAASGNFPSPQPLVPSPQPL